MKRVTGHRQREMRRRETRSNLNNTGSCSHTSQRSAHNMRLACIHHSAVAPGNGDELVCCTFACIKVVRRRHAGNCSKDCQLKKHVHPLEPCSAWVCHCLPDNRQWICEKPKPRGFRLQRFQNLKLTTQMLSRGQSDIKLFLKRFSFTHVVQLFRDISTAT
jgi:hypothetical protein